VQRTKHPSRGKGLPCGSTRKSGFGLALVGLSIDESESAVTTRGAKLGRNAAEPQGRRKLRRAKPHGRRRRETKPARLARAQFVERVAKPCGRKVAGMRSPRDPDLACCMCRRGRKPMEGVGCREAPTSVVREIPWRAAKLAESRMNCFLTDDSSRLAWEDRMAETYVNGAAGSLKQYRRYQPA
jgi:hypothetical protein